LYSIIRAVAEGEQTSREASENDLLTQGERERMRLGILGGTFDPVHFGHLLLAEQCREQCRLDELWLVPAGQPPHKTHQVLTPGRVRAEMLELATAGHSGFHVQSLELDRPGPSFTVDTLQQLHDADPDRQLFFLIGADSLVELPAWREPRRIVELARLVVVNRGQGPLPDREPLRSVLGEDGLARIEIVTMPAVDLSASDIRRRVQAGKSIRYMTPRAVECYIAANNLYTGR
jgi:nicotinate-nucleotide adenylyltransferase